MIFRHKVTVETSVEKNGDARLDRAEQMTRDHARRLLRLEAEAGILRPSPMTGNKEKLA